MTQLDFKSDDFNLGSLVLLLIAKARHINNSESEESPRELNSYFIEIEKFLDNQKANLSDIQENFLYRDSDVESDIRKWLRNFL